MVDRAVTDIIAVDRGAAAEMVPVRGVQNIFVGPLRPRQHADDIARHLLGDAVVETQRRLDPGERNSLETLLLPRFAQQIGRASCRDRVCPYVWIAVVSVSLKKKKQ